MNVILVNGINTNYGGANSHIIDLWTRSLSKSCDNFQILNTVPPLIGIKSKKIYKILLSIYFLPGTVFRIFRFPLAEFIYKISPLLIFKFIKFKKIIQSDLIIFSHHSIFYLSLLVRRDKRVFVIHDLMYRRARSMGYSKLSCRFILGVELFFYKFASKLLAVSYQEQRILRFYIDVPVKLISCYKFNLPLSAIKVNTYLDRDESSQGASTAFAVISDWRRRENLHGLIKFFSDTTCSNINRSVIKLVIYGFDSDVAVKSLSPFANSSGIELKCYGPFNSINEVREKFYLVPIYWGAGIKIKTLEGIGMNKIIVGTPGAFIGIPPWILGDIAIKVRSVNDLWGPIKSPPCDRFVNFSASFNEFFCDIHQAIKL